MATPQQFQTFNGFHNNFWGWGGEDVEAYWRILKGANYSKIHQADKQTTLWDMLPHVKQKEKHNHKNPKAAKMQKTLWKQWKTVGLNNLKYSRVDMKSCKLFTYIMADLYAPKK